MPAEPRITLRPVVKRREERNSGVDGGRTQTLPLQFVLPCLHIAGSNFRRALPQPAEKGCNNGILLMQHFATVPNERTCGGLRPEADGGVQRLLLATSDGGGWLVPAHHQSFRPLFIRTA